MTRPTRIEILGQTFEVQWQSDPTGETSLFREKADGLTNVTAQVIAVRDAGHGPHQYRDTVLHEVLHAIIKMTGHNEDFEEEMKGEEKVVFALSGVLLDVLRSNPGLVTWLTQKIP